MLDDFVVWANANPNLASWAQGIGTVLAAMIALMAAGVAFAGAKAEANAVRDAARGDQLETTRALAAALWAELTDYGQRLEIVEIELLSAGVSTASALPSLSIEGSIYAASTASLGRLPANVVFDVVRAYKLIEDVNRNLIFVPPLSSLNERDLKKLEDQLNLPMREIVSVVRQLAAISGVKPGTSHVEGMRTSLKAATAHEHES